MMKNSRKGEATKLGILYPIGWEHRELQHEKNHVYVQWTIHRKQKSLHANRWIAWLGPAMKDVASCIKLWRGACSLWTRDFLMWLHFKSVRMGNAGDWNILVPAGKKINWDAVSKSDWKQHKANWILFWKKKEMWCYKTAFYLLSGTQIFPES